MLSFGLKGFALSEFDLSRLGLDFLIFIFYLLFWVFEFHSGSFQCLLSQQASSVFIFIFFFKENFVEGDSVTGSFVFEL